MSVLVYSMFSGLVYGLILFMLASGLTLVFGLMGIINFAHASFYMLGAYFAWVMAGWIGFWGALLVAPLVVAIIGLWVEVFLLRRVHTHGHGAELLVTFGLLLVFEEVVKMFFGTGFVDYAIPEGMRFTAFTFDGMNFPFYRLFVAAVALLLFLIIYLVMSRTRVGIVVRAAVTRPDMVGALGHNVSAIMAGVFALGCWMAGVAGVLGGALMTTTPQMAIQQAITVFVVVVVGGLGSLEGALYASLLIGVLSSVAVNIDVSMADLTAYLGFGDVLRDAGSIFNVRLSAFAGSVPVILMLLVLLARPAGLRGERL